MEEKNTKKSKLYKILFIIGCIVLAVALSFGIKTMIDYKNNDYNEERPYGEEVTCKAGEYLDTTSNTCKECPAGGYCNNNKYNTCPSGQMSEAGSADVGDCKDVGGNNGECTDANGNSTYLECPGGGVIRTGCNTFAPCPAGSYCESCVEKKCPVGRYCPKGSTLGIVCPTGHYCDVDGLSSPKSCAILGKYQDETGATSCKDCPSGEIPNVECTACVDDETLIGYFSPSELTVIIGESAEAKSLFKEGVATKATCWDTTIVEGESIVEFSENSCDVIVKGLTEGTAKIKQTLKFADANGNVLGTSDQFLTVNVVKATSVALNKTSVTIVKGKTEQLNLYSAGATDAHKVNDKATWKSENLNVVTVSNGLLTAVKEGTTTVTASYGGITRECTVTVISAPIEELQCSIDGSIDSNATTIGVGESIKLKALGKINGKWEDVSDQVHWYNDGSGSTGNINLNADGTITGASKTTDDKPVKIQASVTVNGDKLTNKDAYCNITVIDTEYKVSVSSKNIYLALDDSTTVTATVKDTNDKEVENVKLEVREYDSSKVVPKLDHENKKITIASRSVANTTDTVKICVYKTDSCDTVKVTIHCTKWTEVSSTKTFKTGYLLSDAHITANRCYYMDKSDCAEVKDEDGKVIEYKCTKYYNRCCGTTGGSDSGGETTEKDACYVNKSSGIHVWGKYANDSNYTLVSEKTTRDDCIAASEGAEGNSIYACYKDDNNNYQWAETAPEGYKLVESIKDEVNCKLSDNAACYEDKDGKYRWGNYANNDTYKLVEKIKTAENCNTPAACYKDNKGNFVWGNYSYNDAYTLIVNLNEKNCNAGIKVPITAANTATIVYISVIVMLMFGGFVVYYVYNKKK